MTLANPALSLLFAALESGIGLSRYGSEHCSLTTNMCSRLLKSGGTRRWRLCLQVDMAHHHR